MFFNTNRPPSLVLSIILYYYSSCCLVSPTLSASISDYPDCIVQFTSWIGDDYCDGGLYTTESCGFDAGDCTLFNTYPDCTVQRPSSIGDGRCDGGLYNTESCGFDAGDCELYNTYPDCNVDDPSSIGNGRCDRGGLHDTEPCGFDGGDCGNTADAADLRNFILSEFWLGQVPPSECGRVPSPLYKWYWDCFYDTYLSLISSSSPAGKESSNEGNTALLLVEPPVRCSTVRTLEDSFCESGDALDCLQGTSNWGGCDETWFCTMDYSTRQLYQQCSIIYGQPYVEITSAMAAVDYSNPLQVCPHEALPEGMIPNVDLWRCMYRDLKSRIPEGFDFFQKFIDYTGYVLPPGCSPGQDSNSDEEYIRCASQSVRTILPDNVPSNSTIDVLRERIVNFLDEQSQYYSADSAPEDECGAIPNEITLEYWQCFLEKLQTDFGVAERELIGSEVNSWGKFLQQLSRMCISAIINDPFDVDDNLCGFCDIETCSNSPDGRPPSAADFFESFLNRNPNKIPDPCSDSAIDSAGMTTCTIQYLLSPPATTSAPTSRHSDVTESDDFFQNTFQSLIDESKANSIAQIVSSVISFISSVAIMCVIYRSYIGVSTTFHRILMALSVSDATSSFWMMLATVPVPTSARGYIWNPMGNVHSCNTQGFFLYLGIMAAPLYNCSLCLYYLAVVKYNKKDAYIRAKLEPYLLAIPAAITLILATTILSLRSFNPILTHCWVAEGEPYLCEEGLGVCWERGEGTRTLFSVTVAGLFTLLPCVIVVTMTIMYKAAKKNEEKLSKYGVGALRVRANLGNPPDDTNVKHGLLRSFKASWKRFSTKNSPGTNGTRSNNAKKQSRVIFEKALLYSIAYFATYIFVFVNSMYYWVGREVPFGLDMASSIIFPLQGFFNFVVFMYPRVKSARKKTKKGLFQSFWTALKSRGDKKNRPRNLPRSNLKNKNKP